MVAARKARAVGFNHVALEVGDIDEALAFYDRLFDFKLRARAALRPSSIWADQFLALQKGRTQPADDGRHFGLVVDNKDAVRKALLPGPFLDFLDPWGNRIEIVDYDTSNSPRRRTWCAAWDWCICQRTRQRSKNSLRRAWHRTRDQISRREPWPGRQNANLGSDP
jgi:lactoylglutathione lyase